MRNLKRDLGVQFLPGRWVEWHLAPLKAILVDGRTVDIVPGDWVLLGRNPQTGGYTEYLWHKKRTVH